mmetsp:Transcript_70868/g.169677  ORF Transcript_70868/g.169677 Transcript_70868/m.169677 type:complete len:397 (-) Transcript_70868:126-1316(-)|eukprot:CAMPEP_0178440734 /NCGR_PEP_ID=MMETSP0689_2-20121128/36967_1 /TAXON_ID=160604 /ORGANISM="Amphidinium massartii, Strain CS-259" /LENGTH=396 /DNA_ID=CAMNT_0020063589 /DNA_START=62 /DNA_END=1252 /DNA_ORIENTATION=-
MALAFSAWVSGTAGTFHPHRGYYTSGAAVSRPSTSSGQATTVGMAALGASVLGGYFGSRSYQRSSRRTSKIWKRVASVDVVKAELKKKEAAYQQRQAQARGPVIAKDLPELADLSRTSFIGQDGLLQVPAVEAGVRASVYAIFDANEQLQYTGVSRNSQASLRAHFARLPEQCGAFAVFDLRKPDRSLLEAIRQKWQDDFGSVGGNDQGAGQASWESPLDVRLMATEEERAQLEAAAPAQAAEVLKDIVRNAEQAQAAKFVELGCEELLVFDGKLKAKGLLDLDLSAPIGTPLPAGGASAAFTLKMCNPDGSEVEVECPMDMTILEAAEAADIELPSSCKSGACSACAAKVIEGEINQADQSFLDEAQEAAGYVLTCVCYPRSDLVLEMDKQRDVA